MVLCPKCTSFHASEMFGNMCSRCFNGAPPKGTGVPLNKVNEWVTGKLLNRSFISLLKRCAGKNEKSLARVLRTLTKHNNWSSYEGRWITAKVAHDLLTEVRGKVTPKDAMLTIDCIVLSRVIDFWNIKNVFGDSSTHYCYFGQPSCVRPKQLPPKYSILTETHISTLKY